MFLGKKFFLKHGITENATNYKVTLCRPSGFVVGYIRYCHAYMIKKKVWDILAVTLEQCCQFDLRFFKKMHRTIHFFLKQYKDRFWCFLQERSYFYNLFAFSWKTRKFWTKFHMDLIRNVKGTQKLQLYFSKDNCCGTFSSKRMCNNQYLIHNSVTTLSWVTDFFKSSVGFLALMIIITCCQ